MTTLHTSQYTFKTFESIAKHFLTTIEVQAEEWSIQLKRLSSNVSICFDKKTIWFNDDIVNQTGYYYSTAVIIHDLYHVFKQNVITNHDVKRLKDISAYYMTLFEIEADYFMFDFLRIWYGFTYTDYLKIYFSSKGYFRDPTPRMPKVERFIGSSVSLYSLYFQNGEHRGHYEVILSTPTDQKTIIAHVGNRHRIVDVVIPQEQVKRVVELFELKDILTECSFVMQMFEFIDQLMKSIVHRKRDTH